MRIRLRFTKQGKIRFIGHRDVARIWERSLRKAKVPMAYTEGFNPRPKMHFGLALSVGHESLAEFMDIDVVPREGEPIDLAALPAQLSAVLPIGLAVTAAEETVSVGATSLQQAVTSCDWLLTVEETSTSLVDAAIEKALNAPEIVVTRQRKGKDVTDDIRPYLRALERLEADEHQHSPADQHSSADQHRCVLAVELGTQPRGVRPAELLAALDPPLSLVHARRIHQWIEDDGHRAEPLISPDSSSVHARARAS